MLVFFSDFDRFRFIKESSDELIVEDMQLQEDVVRDFSIFDLKIEETKGLQAFDDLTEDWRRDASHLLHSKEVISLSMDVVEEDALRSLVLKFKVQGENNHHLVVHERLQNLNSLWIEKISEGRQCMFKGDWDDLGVRVGFPRQSEFISA